MTPRGLRSIFSTTVHRHKMDHRTIKAQLERQRCVERQTMHVPARRVDFYLFVRSDRRSALRAYTFVSALTLNSATVACSSKSALKN